jgi:hypothetical protein
MPSVTVVGIKEVNKRLSNLRAYGIRVENFPSLSLVSPQAVKQAVANAKEFYKAPANGTKRPMRWKNPAQRVAVMIKLKEMGGAPYKRTGAFEEAWISETATASITITNTAKSDKGTFLAPVIVGAFQQPFHSDTGWQKRSAQIEKQIIAPIRNDISKQLLTGIASSRYG